LRASPGDLAQLGRALAERLNGGSIASLDALPEATATFVETAAASLAGARHPLIVAGTTLGSAAVLEAAAEIARALARSGQSAALSLVFTESNSVGSALLGGGRLSEAFAAVEAGRVDTVIILENDLYRRAAPHDVDAFLRRVPHVIALDAINHRTVEAADVALPTGTFAESDGTVVNNEGRAQRFFQVLPPDPWIRESWRWIGELGGTPTWPNLDAVIAGLIDEFPALAGVQRAAPAADFRVTGQKFARASRRASGRTALRAHLAVSEPRPPDDLDGPLSFSMEGYAGRAPAALANIYWAPGWNSAQSLNKFQSEISGPIKGGDPGERLLDRPSSANAASRIDVSLSRTGRSSERDLDTGLLAVPRHHIFGSEELSALAPAIAERSTGLYAELHPDAARALGLVEGALVRVKLERRELVLPLHLEPDLPSGLVTLPVGLPDLAGLDLPAAVTLKGEP